MALDATIPIDGDGVTTGVRVSELAGSIRTLRTDINTLRTPFETGWIPRSDWTNVHMGSSTTKDADSDVTHNLGFALTDLGVKVLLSTGGTDVGSFEIPDTGSNTGQGITVYNVSTDALRIQTSANGFFYVQDAAGAVVAIDTEDWFYKIKIWELG